MSRINKDIKKIMNRAQTDEITIISADLVETSIRGFFSFNYEKHNLDGRPLATNGPVFSCKWEEVKNLKTKDKVRFEDQVFIVSDVKRDTLGFCADGFPIDDFLLTLDYKFRKDNPGEVDFNLGIIIEKYLK